MHQTRTVAAHQKHSEDVCLMNKDSNEIIQTPEFNSRQLY